MLSDGQNSYAYAMITTQLNHIISENKIEPFTIVKILKFIVTRFYGKRKNIFVLDLEIPVPGKEVNYFIFIHIFI